MAIGQLGALPLPALSPQLPPDRLRRAAPCLSLVVMSVQIRTPHGDWTMLTEDDMGLLGIDGGEGIQAQAADQRRTALQAYCQQNPPLPTSFPIVILPIGARAWPCIVRMGCLTEDILTIASSWVQKTDRPLDLAVITDENPPQLFLAGVEPERFQACVAAHAYPPPSPPPQGVPTLNRVGIFAGPDLPKGQSVLLVAYGRRRQHAQWRTAHPHGDLPIHWQHLMTRKLGEGIGGKIKDTLTMDRNMVSTSPPKAATSDPYLWDGQHGHSSMLGPDQQVRRNLSIPGFEATMTHLYGLKRDARFGLQELSHAEEEDLRRTHAVAQGVTLVKIVSGAVCGPNGPFHLGVHLHEYQNLPQMEYSINPFVFDQPVGAWTPAPEHALGFFPPTTPLPAALVWMAVCHSTAATGVVVQFISLATQAYLSTPDHLPTAPGADRVTAKIHLVPRRGGDEPSVAPASPTPVEVLRPALVAREHPGTLWLVEAVPERSFLYEYGDTPLQSLA